MAKRVQRISQNTAQAAVFTGLPGEFTHDSGKKTVRVHDGVNPGGTPLALEDLSSSPAATNSADGKMTAALVTNLETAESDVADLKKQVNTGISKAITGNTTLSTDENKHAVIEFTGTLVADAIITIDSAPHDRYFINSTTGGFSLIVKTATATTVEVPSGSVKQLSVEPVSGDVFTILSSSNILELDYDDIVAADNVLRNFLRDLADKRAKLAGDTFTGDVTVNGTLAAAAALTVGTTLNVTGGVVLGSTLNVAGNLAAESTFVATGLATFNGGATIASGVLTTQAVDVQGAMSSSVGGSIDADTLENKSLSALYDEFPFLRGHIDGNILSRTSTVRLTAAVGVVRDDTNSAFLNAIANIAKDVNAPWAVGNNQGGLDTGTVAADTPYHVHRIKRSDTDVVDLLFSLSATSPVMPTNYDLKQRIGGFRTDGSSQIIDFYQDGDEFIRKVPIEVDNQANPGIAARLIDTKVLTGLKVRPIISVYVETFGTGSIYGLVTSPDQDDTLPTATVNNYNGRGDGGLALGRGGSMIDNFRSNTSGELRTRITISGAGVIQVMTSFGWIDPRSKNA